jgi:septum formation topological specificity factor MinE
MSGKKDELSELLGKATTVNFKIDTNKSDDSKIKDDSTNKDRKKRKLIVNDDKDLGISEEEIHKMRDDTLGLIEKHIQEMKSSIQKDKLADYMLENRIELLEKSKYMLNEYMVTVLTELRSSSRAFEVLAKMLETVTAINDSVVNINDDKKKTKSEKDDGKLSANTSDIIKQLVENNIEASLEQRKFREKDKDAIRVVNGGK